MSLTDAEMVTIFPPEPVCERCGEPRDAEVHDLADTRHGHLMGRHAYIPPNRGY